MSVATGSLSRLRGLVRREGREITVPGSRGLSLMRLARVGFEHAQQTSLLAFAGNLTYNAFLAIFPFLLFLVSLLKAFHAEGLITYPVDVASRTLPRPATQVIRHQVLPEVLSRLTNSPILSFFLALGSLWAVSFVARAIVQGMNQMYEVEDRRPLWQRFLLPLLMSVGAAALFLAALALIVFGSVISTRIGTALGSGSAGWWAWAVLRWPLLVALALLACALTYYVAPDLSPRPRFVTAGAVLATAAWLIFSAAFSLVLNHFAQFLVSPLYGWFTGLIILLMYLYWSSVILLAGAVINRVIEAHARNATESRVARKEWVRRSQCGSGG